MYNRFFNKKWEDNLIKNEYGENWEDKEDIFQYYNIKKYFYKKIIIKI